MSMDDRLSKPREYNDGRTKQSMEAETNINNIMAKVMKGGELEHISEALGEFRDMSGIPDLHEAMTIVANANSLFQELPAEVRKACDHDAGNFLPWLDDPENRDDAIDFGLLTGPKSVPTPPKPEETPIDPEPVAEDLA